MANFKATVTVNCNISVLKGMRKRYFGIAALLSVLVLTGLSSCKSLGKLSAPEDTGLMITRKYVGNFIEFRHTGPETLDGPNIIWIKTTLEGTYGKISGYGKKCDFKPGERLYLRRTYYSPGITAGYWVYTVENDSLVSYRATDFQHDRKIMIEQWFE